MKKSLRDHTVHGLTSVPANQVAESGASNGTKPGTCGIAAATLSFSQPESPPRSGLLQTDPRPFSRPSVSVSAVYDEDDGRTKWNVDVSDTSSRQYAFVELYELRSIGPPFNRDRSYRVFSLMVTREQLVELGKAIGEAVGQ